MTLQRNESAFPVDRPHLSDVSCLEPTDTGFFEARCECGFRVGPLPDRETLVDVLMEHAWNEGALAPRLHEGDAT